MILIKFLLLFVNIKIIGKIICFFLELDIETVLLEGIVGSNNLIVSYISTDNYF